MKPILTIVLVALLLFTNLIKADISEQTKAEIEHLLDYVKNSKITFIRNSSSYSPADAVKHMNRKFEHFKKEINTAEQFIEKCATKSLLSGKPYQVKLEDQTVMEAADWFLKELSSFREKQKTEEKNK